LYIRRKTAVFRKWVIVQQAHRGECIRRGQLHVIFAAVGICFCGMLIKCLEVSHFLAFAQSCGMLIESLDLKQSFEFPEKFRSI